MATFRHEGRRLAYTVHGEGERTTVLIHGLLLSQKMHLPLARALAARGNRVVTVDLLGHGRSDRPRDMTQYSMAIYGRQVVALLDHLEVERAVLAGTSLGANTVLEAAAHAPERAQGLIVEMPVLDNALLGCAVAFTPLMLALTFGAPGMRVLARAANLVPSGFAPWLADVGLDTIRQAPEPSAAVL
ncbi:MAG: alpha/beta fold hydrolase [Solirubrobacteraceae bacterium]